MGETWAGGIPLQVEATRVGWDLQGAEAFQVSLEARNFWFRDAYVKTLAQCHNI